MTQAAVGSIAPIVAVNGQDLAATVMNSVIGVRVSSGLRLPSRAVLDFVDDGFAISAGEVFTLGAQVTIKTSGDKQLFVGEVTGVQLDVERGAPNLTVTADDAAYKMTLGNKVRTFTKVTYANVVETIAGDYGLSVKSDATSGTHDYLLQSDSDFGFLTEIADRIGFDWWIDPDGKLQFHAAGKGAGGAEPTLRWGSTGGGLRSFSVRASALHPGTATVNGWDSSGKQAMTVSSQPANHEPTAALVGPFLTADKLKSHNTVLTSDRMYAVKSDGDGFAASIATKATFGASTAVGVCLINPNIVVGSRVTVEECGPASGSYPVSEVEHTYTLRGFETRFTAGDREPTSLVDTLAAPRTSSFRQDALVVGVVTNVGGGEAPKGHIKVKFPTLGDGIESAWARVVSMGAGNSRGSTFLPEVNDEVIIGFEGGDVSRPLVLGGVYNGKDAALDFGIQNGAVNRRQIVSRLGHVIELGDGSEPADQHIWLTLAGGEFAIKLGKDGLAATVASGKPVSITAGQASIKIDDQGNITLDGNKITLKAKQGVDVSGSDIKLKTKGQLEGSASLGLKLSGGTGAELTAHGVTTIKGSLVKIN